MRILRCGSAEIADDVDEVADGEIVVALTRDELALFAGGIRESLEEIEDWEFDTRLGVTRSEAREILNHTINVLGSIPLDEWPR
ncbi:MULTISPECIES: hypothetical protein [unclassified Mycolicibacterium]|uniref:hypothetical protein n=1 Tax=unclassified Mycolicibacterium TaxID=2636767 RepID=UPI0012DDFB18|nr:MULTISPECIES: hypothetical protein [unclassified Mycolicibacterium]MUL84771.1 hypothetical protein [Mycolicibacterium sp. CBMA 329]MUL88546.1 hypothetical protein [Mycolicibacterium sp. CBMA 331]MUM00114.1 hypothetical protein [Mycolicibacterium sp. CBMA 334]MUM30290.1 hypothetical protein [Mycolicibacterium sp. CBMA 295]MUM40193.1 hypothetical protein [Mycolicibacterium sp. CBMA 247]